MSHYTDAALALDSGNTSVWTIKVQASYCQGDKAGIARVAPHAKRWSPRPDYQLDGYLAIGDRSQSERFLGYSAEQLRVSSLFDTIWVYYDTKIAAALNLAEIRRTAIYADSTVRLRSNRVVTGSDAALILSGLAFAQSLLGQNDQAASTLARAIALARKRSKLPLPVDYWDPPTVAATLMRLGESREAIRWMVAALEGEYTAQAFASNSKLFVFHGKPEFEAFLRAHKQ